MNKRRNWILVMGAVAASTIWAGALMAQGDGQQHPMGGQDMHGDMMEEGGMMGMQGMMNSMMGDMDEMMEGCNAMMDRMQQGHESDRH